MVIALSILLSAAALMAVAYPIVAPATKRIAPISTSQEALDELMAQRDAAFQALRDLAFDHRVGKITDEDFVAFEANLKQTAASALKSLDEWEGAADQDLDQALERQVAVRRKTLMASGGRLCVSCGHPAAPEDRFCAACGSALPAVEPSIRECPKCSRPYEAKDRFCAGCGYAFATALVPLDKPQKP